MGLCLTRDPCGFVEEGADGSGGAEAATLVPALCGGFIDSCFYVLQWRHTWGKNVVVGNVRHHLQVIDGQKPLGILSGENVDSYGGAECYPPYVPLP